MSVCVETRARALLLAVPATSGAIWGTDDFNALELQTHLCPTFAGMKPRQLGPVKLNRLIWVGEQETDAVVTQ